MNAKILAFIIAFSPCSTCPGEQTWVEILTPGEGNTFVFQQDAREASIDGKTLNFTIEWLPRDTCGRYYPIASLRVYGAVSPRGSWNLVAVSRGETGPWETDIGAFPFYRFELFCYATFKNSPMRATIKVSPSMAARAFPADFRNEIREMSGLIDHELFLSSRRMEFLGKLTLDYFSPDFLEKKRMEAAGISRQQDPDARDRDAYVYFKEWVSLIAFADEARAFALSLSDITEKRRELAQIVRLSEELKRSVARITSRGVPAPDSLREPVEIQRRIQQSLLSLEKYLIDRRIEALTKGYERYKDDISRSIDFSRSDWEEQLKSFLGSLPPPDRPVLTERPSPRRRR